MQIENGWLDVARRVPSPNVNARPEGEISALVLHSISLPPGEFGGDAIEALFTNCLDTGAHPYYRRLAGLRVSAHLLIRRDGEAVQFAAFDARAWHAGRSRWFDGVRERRELNDFGIGIELEGDEIHPYRDAQYRRLAGVVGTLMAHYPGLDATRITSHARIAPLRKSDPGPAFDWAYFRQCLAAQVPICS
ncbi:MULTISPECIES: 1,6-anhydro-N-acetylmuramyl-L-alanine amidase AmpD [unclassified Modicisalibacter]|uniref:1,6-anhydro-N-acetylmuramyl-L-alanine amidase AmpD n=1 Tax=unclassified Modicisalibacter TaxID=2679913 RepID=UPI001CCB9F6C|nr:MULTISPECIES: 1,6-anhydro-N-acetylmuramyl-L-alanine amidase AmpD [unclassified Modicisalibacter]MBZ9557811.1 1,6-anhydro-N-acetylmuramyl-L-alanine amidase AmpD [Modicisalibacter sp. R2A 31.J]MBZ9573523.1 1,6-anhydro-N-acetylmuramyl-L-alanine amidase AmpD [Modicisalibacter sp. MOD 31.J]